MSDYSIELGNKIRKLIEEAEISQRQFAIRVGISPSGLSHFLKGRVPDAITFSKIARELGRTSDDLLAEVFNDGIVVAESTQYGLSQEEKDLLRAYRGSDKVTRKYAKEMMERHQEDTQKKAGA